MLQALAASHFLVVRKAGIEHTLEESEPSIFPLYYVPVGSAKQAIGPIPPGAPGKGLRACQGSVGRLLLLLTWLPPISSHQTAFPSSKTDIK